ncbi:MAG: hypothetical protein CV087_11795 [Candidatus Brocadia sp. WS118]|nr:MAG: hypothetical protein CV087_11795 [Candidatus Brocadia sp. WS118]
MPETAVEQCGGYDLLENLLGKNYPLANNSGFRISDINSNQSDAGNEDKGEKEAISFQTIMKQQINDPGVQDTHSLQKSTGAASTRDTTELFQEDIDKTNPFELPHTHLCGSSHSMGKNPNIYHSFKEKFDDYSSLTQRGETGLDQNYSGNQIINILPSSTILPNTFIDYSESDIQNVNQSQVIKNRIVMTNPQLNMDNYFTSHGDRNNYSAFSTPEGKIKGIDTQKNEKFISLNNLSESFFGAMQASGFTGSDMNKINVKELPSAFKSQSHQVSPESVNTSFVQAVNALSHTGEKDTQNDLSKINGDATSQENIPVVQQTNNEESNFMTEQEKAGYTPDDAQLQKTHKGHSFFEDTQKTTIGTQVYTNDIQKNTELFFENSVRQLSSLENPINREIHTYHSSLTAETGHLHSSIMEQLFQKISLVNHGDRSEIKLHLTPPELGSIKIHFSEENDEITAKIFVEDAEVKAAIENNVHRLKESVAVSGFEIQKLEVFIQQDKTYEEKYSENPEANNQQYYQGKSQGGSNEDHPEQQNNISNNAKKEINGKTTNLMVDYII